MRIELPWPPSETSANASRQGSWRKKANAAKSYKVACAYECMAQKVGKLGGFDSVRITFHPPRNGRLDFDNITGRAKQGWDAVSEAIGIDDSLWWPVTLDKGDKVAGGLIVIEFVGSSAAS